MQGIKLQNHIIAHNQPCFIIAEAGVNHNGDTELAKQLIDVAKDAGADAVKFQTFITDEIILRDAPKANYHIETTGDDKTQTWYELLKSQELNREQHIKLIEYCKSKDIIFLSTPYDWRSVDLLDELDVQLFKIASTDASNTPFLRYMAKKGRPMILSTAMTNLDEINNSVELIKSEGVNDLVVLQCTGSYPAPVDQANITAMRQIADTCDVAVGYSDHVSGYNAAIAAIALGACVYEKHFTISRDLPGPDHRASLEPNELKELINAIRQTESALGNGDKNVMPCEEANRNKLRKFIVARKEIKRGDKFGNHNLTTKRTGGIGIKPTEWDNLLDEKAQENFKKDQPIIIGDNI
jgi:N-acetylneuraminate synthase/N,N'-diacetyllegionaminate synthase